MKRNSKSIAQKAQRRETVAKHASNPDYNVNKYEGGRFHTHHEDVTQLNSRCRKQASKPHRAKDRRSARDDEAPRFAPHRTLQLLAAKPRRSPQLVAANG